MLKSYRVGWGGVVAYEILVSAQGPLVLVLRLRVWGQGLTIASATGDKSQHATTKRRSRLCSGFLGHESVGGP